jgi:drug/metabolite transporter (DMT)-like permease
MTEESITLSPPTQTFTNAPLLITILLMIDSLHFVFARLLVPYLPPATSALFVLAIATAEVALFIAARGRPNLTTFRRHARFFLAIGFLVAVSTNLNYLAVTFIDPGIAAMLAKTSVLFGLGFGLFWLRDRLSGLESVGALIAIAGVFIITFQPGDYLRLGSLLVLASTFMYAAHAAIVKRYGEQIDFADFFLFRLAATTSFLFLLAVGQGDLVWPGGRAWLILLLAGTLDVAISRALYYTVLRRLKISLHQLIMTLSPVVTIGWSLLLFGSVPTLQELIGGLTVICGILLVTAGQLKAGRPAKTANSTSR